MCPVLTTGGVICVLRAQTALKQRDDAIHALADRIQRDVVTAPPPPPAPHEAHNTAAAARSEVLNFKDPLEMPIEFFRTLLKSVLSFK
jgi:hypothetical protein